MHQIIYNMTSMNIAMVSDDITRTFVITMVITIVVCTLYVGMLQWVVIAALAILTAYTIANAAKKHKVV